MLMDRVSHEFSLIFAPQSLTFLPSSAKRVANLHVTPDSVTNKLAKVPLTSHPLAEAAKFVFDAWTMPGLLAPTAAGVPGETVILATVHGEFIERKFFLCSVPRRFFQD